MQTPGRPASAAVKPVAVTEPDPDLPARDEHYVQVGAFRPAKTPTKQRPK